MKNIKKLFAFFLAAPLFLSSCIMNNGICYTHVDNNKDGLCDVCGSKVKTEGSGSESSSNSGDIEGNPCTTHVDHDLDGTCDVCGATMSAPAHDHIDGNQDGHCDICNATMVICNNHYDANGDGKCDNCGAQMPVITGDVTTYLVLSSVGLYKGAKGTTYSEANVEYAVKFIQPVGTDLPGASEVTHLYGSADFSGWVAYEGVGAPTVYTKVPAVNNKILYAQFTANGTAPSTPTPDDPGTTDADKACTLRTNFEGGNWSDADAKIYAYCWGGTNNGQDAGSKAYECTKVDNNTFTFAIHSYYQNILFVRVNPSGYFTTIHWDDVWDQTQDMSVDSTKTIVAITGWQSAQWVAA